MTAFGAYGKIPALGDFFRIGAVKPFSDPWDQWLQTVLRQSRDTLGAQWGDCYMTAPIWRFKIGAGLAGACPASGILMPSVDRVGRQFPLTLVSVCGDLSDDAFAQAEDLALAALDDAMTRDRLVEALAGIPVLDADAGAGAEWQAVLADRTLAMSTKGLPIGEEALKLFDLGRWTDPADNMAEENA